MYFPDLSPFQHCGNSPNPFILNVGWLSIDYPFQRGNCDKRFVEALRLLAASPIKRRDTEHLCEFCPPPGKSLFSGLRGIKPQPEKTGSGEIWVPGSNRITFVAPVLVLHYVVVHKYAPPLPFIEAAIRVAAKRAEPKTGQSKTYEPPGLLSKGSEKRLLSLSQKKKVAFLLLLYERMLPQLHSFCREAGLDPLVFEKARELFWRSLTVDFPTFSWQAFEGEILDAIPDSEDYGSLEASYAINSGFVAAYICALIAGGQDAKILEALGCPYETLDFYIREQISVQALPLTFEPYMELHPLSQRELQTQDEDISFLAALPDHQWTDVEVGMLRGRSQTQPNLLFTNP